MVVSTCYGKNLYKYLDFNEDNNIRIGNLITGDWMSWSDENEFENLKQKPAIRLLQSVISAGTANVNRSTAKVVMVDQATQYSNMP